MKNIDAVEGIVKYILTALHQYSIANRIEDTDYISNVKTIIEATKLFLEHNIEIIDDPQLVTDILYQFSKDLWLKYVDDIKKNELQDTESLAEHHEYNEYYYDYIYHHGIYPK